MAQIALRIRRLVWVAIAVVLLGLLLCFIVSHYPPFGRLDLPCPRQGKVVDAETGAPVAGAFVSVEWQIYDYPMIDGGGSYPVSIWAKTLSDGMFLLPVSTHRRGFFHSDGCPPYITAEGYRSFTYSDTANFEGGLLVYRIHSLKRIENKGD